MQVNPFFIQTTPFFLVLGLQCHSSMHGCSWCTIFTRGENAYQILGQPRTLGHIREMAAAYEANGRKNAMKYFNCVHPPLLEGPDDTPIIQLVPPPGKTVLLKGVTICKL